MSAPTLKTTTAGLPRARRRPVRKDIQALRALAVVVVLAYHFTPSLMPGGYVGVDIFFVISGFVITSLMISEVQDTGRIDLQKFYARRARRILPAATVTILATVVAGLILSPLNTWGDLAHDAFFTSIFGQNWHLAVGSVDYLAGGSSPSPMQHFWSLSIEEQFYFLWPAALVGAYYALRKTSVRSAALIVLVPTIVISFGLSVFAVTQGDASAYFTTHTRAWQLALGALVAAMWPVINRFTKNDAQALEPGNAPLTVRTGCLVVVGVVLNAYALFTYTGQTAFPGMAALLPTIGTGALIAAGLPAARWVKSPVVQWLGNVSYSLYLVHWPVAIFLPKSLGQVAWVVIGLGLSLGLAGLSYRMVEQELPRKLTRLRHSNPTIIMLKAGAVAIAIGMGTAGVTQLVFSTNVSSLERQAEQLQEEHPDGFGAESIDSTQYTSLLPGTRGTAPSRASVREDVPQTYSHGCVAENTDPESPRCSYGNDQGETTWVLVGDSHMDQYLPAFERIAEEEGIHLITFFHANCPFNMSQTQQDQQWEDPCKQANEKTYQELQTLDADLIITSNWTDVDWAEDPVEGFVQAWEELPAPVMVIADNPAMQPADGTTTCVVENYPETERCARDKHRALPTDHQLPAVEQSQEQGMKVGLVDLTEAYCTDDECPPVIGNVMVYRDPHHVTATYAQTLAPLVAERIEEVWQNENWS